MLFQHTITIPPNTSEDSPLIELMDVDYGVITNVKVRPRAGHTWLAHLQIYHNEHQIAPLPRGKSFYGDSAPIDFDEYYKIFQPSFELKLIGWNEDDTYEHNFDVFVTVLPRESLLQETLPEMLGLKSVALIPIESQEWEL